MVLRVHRGWCNISTPRGIFSRNSAPVVQLDRIPGFEPGGCRFESCRVRHILACRLLPDSCSLDQHRWYQTGGSTSAGCATFSLSVIAGAINIAGKRYCAHTVEPVVRRLPGAPHSRLSVIAGLLLVVNIAKTGGSTSAGCASLSPARKAKSIYRQLKALGIETRFPALSVFVSCTRINPLVNDELADVRRNQSKRFCGEYHVQSNCQPSTGYCFLLLVSALFLGSCSSTDFARLQADAYTSAEPRQTTLGPVMPVPAVRGLPTLL